MAHQIVWCDFPVLDMDRAIRFYSAVLGAPVKKQEYPGRSTVSARTASGRLFSTARGIASRCIRANLFVVARFIGPRPRLTR